MKINAIILGATGMVGEGVLHIALRSDDVSSVLVIGRRPCGVTHPKLREILHPNLFDITPIKDQLRGYTACYFCLGVSSLGKSEEEYRRTTYDLTMHIASVLAPANPDMTFCYVSGSGTDETEQGRLRWARVKGKTENDLRTLPFKQTYAFRPGFIKPMAGMKNTMSFAKPLGTLYPLLRFLMPSFVCTLEDLGKAMIAVTLRSYPKPVLENIDITAAAAQHY
uniref:Epimerase n=1 Tax=uncultured bacterium pAM1 TaxID=1781153 RepID=A0A1C9U4Y6_9BACT|nr:epimerase [uncultured bacterium pAM1]